MPSVYEIVTERIIKKLQAGTVPWQRQYQLMPYAVNWQTQRPYSGINTLLLDPGEYLTWNQVKKAGGKVRKGAESHLVTFYKTLDYSEKDPETGEVSIKLIPYLRYYRVFSILDCEGIESKYIKPQDHDPIAAAQAIADDYKHPPYLRGTTGTPSYDPLTDTVSMPPLSHYHTPDAYYSTLFHELIHSTGHADRLDRKSLTCHAAHSSETYSKEELIAAIGSAMLCAKAGIDSTTEDNNAAYIQSWIDVLKGDSRLVVTAAAAAQKAADHITA